MPGWYACERVGRPHPTGRPTPSDNRIAGSASPGTTVMPMRRRTFFAAGMAAAGGAAMASRRVTDSFSGGSSPPPAWAVTPVVGDGRWIDVAPPREPAGYFDERPFELDGELDILVLDLHPRDKTAERPEGSRHEVAGGRHPIEFQERDAHMRRQ